MVQHILVAHDLSPEADLALQRADGLACQLGARLSLLHVLATGAERAAAQARLDAALAACRSPRRELHLRSGHAVEEILRMVRGLEAGLLVLGAHHPQSAEGFAGTIFEQLLQDCPVPLLLAVQPAWQAWQQALVALDFSPYASRALQQAWQLLPDGACLLALHIDEQAAIHALDDPDERQFQRELFEQLVADEQRRLPARPLHLEQAFLSGERDHCLDAVLTAEQPQLLALGAHSRGALADALLGSLALQLLRQPPCDVLLVR